MKIEITMEQISEITGIRIEVLLFAKEMEKKLSANDGKGGWKNCSNDYLVERMGQEKEELQKSINSKNSRRRIINECADVANFAMMIYDNAK